MGSRILGNYHLGLGLRVLGFGAQGLLVEAYQEALRAQGSNLTFSSQGLRYRLRAESP